MKATFLKRFLAYILDVIIISAILSIISASSLNGSNYKKLIEQQKDTIEKYTKEEINIEEYQKEITSLDYEISKESYPSAIIGLVISSAYFIIFQYLNKGQTIGKKLMRIRIRKRDDEKLKLIDIVIRAVIVNSLLTTTISLITVLTANADLYNIIKLTFGTLETLFVLVSGFMILYRKDKLGLQDLITKTQVVIEGK